MDQERTPKHTCRFCSCQLYQWIATCKFHYPTTFQTCIQSQVQQMDCKCYQTTNMQLEGTTHWFQDSNFKPQICGWLHLTWAQVKGMDGMIAKGWEKIGTTKALTPDFQIKAMEANALTPLFTFILKVEEYNDAEDNEAYPTNSITMVIEICLQLNYTPFRVATTCGCTSTSNNVKNV